MGRRSPTASIAAMIRDCLCRGAEPVVRRPAGVSVTYLRDHRIHLVLLILAVLLARVPDLFYHYQDWDEAAMMSQAWAMTRGQVLYRDTFQIHPVLNFAIFYPFFWLLPADAAAHTVKLFNLVLVALGACGVYALVRRWTGDPWAALLAGTVLTHYLGRPWGLSSYGEFYVLLPVLATAWLLFVRERTSTPSLVLVGALWSLSFFIKQVALFDAAALYLSYLLFDGARPFRKLASSFAMGLGALSVAAAVGGYLLSEGTLALAVQSTLVRPMTHYAQLAPGASQGLARTIWELSRRETAGLLAAIKVLPVPLLAAICAPAINFLFDRFSLSARWITPAPSLDGRRQRALCYALFIWLTVDLVGLATVVNFYPHYLVQILPPLSMLVASTVSRLRRPVRIAVTAVAVGLLLGHSAYLSANTLLADRGEPAQVRESREIAALVARATSPNDRIFLYRFRGLDVFYLSGRISNNGIYMFIDMFPEHIKDPQAAAERRRMFLAHPPRILIRDPGGLLLGCRSAEPFFEDLLQTSYCLRARLGRVEVHELCDAGRASVLRPAADLEGVDRFTEQGLGEPLGELDVGDQGHAMVDSGAPDHVVVRQLLL